MNSNWFKLVMKMTKVEYGKNLLLKGVPIIFNKGGAKLKIGENVTIKSSFLSNLVGLYSRTIIVTRAPGAEIEIGNNVGISGATIYARKKITIGENTCIGGNCKILDNDFHPIEAEIRNKLLRDENGGDSDLVPSREIKIGKNCFIGCNSIILKGTVLGDGCVVGAGAVVAGKFENNCVIEGKLEELYKTYGYCLNTLHSYEFDGSAGFAKMQSIMQAFRGDIKEFGGRKVVKLLDYAPGLDGLPKSDVLKFLLEDNCSIVVRPSGTEPKLKTYISVSAENKEAAEKIEAEISKSAEAYLK